MQDEQVANNATNKDEFSFCSSLELRNLGFSFDNNKDVIREFSLIVNKGEKIGIQGTSGRGKSTLFNLMLGFYPLNDGEILIDGVKLTSKNRGEWHKQIGYVPQDVFILDGSIKDNICLSNCIDLDEDKIWAVLKQVNLYDWASSLPCALDTVLGENGAKLSGGQKQRIAIARALYKGASVLFFDEATSALDSKTEEDILNVLQSLCNNYKDITLFMIAHRDSSLKMCSRIINL